MRIKVRVWKVTEYDVTMDVGQGDDLHAKAIALAEQGHSTDFVDRLGVVDKGTFPLIRSVDQVAE